MDQILTAITLADLWVIQLVQGSVQIVLLGMIYGRTR